MSTDAELIVTLQTMQKTLKRVLDSYKSLSKSFEKFDKPESLARQDYLADAISALKTADLGILGCADQKSLITGELEDRLRTLRMNAHRNLITGITALIENPAHIKIVSDNPLVIYVHPLTLEVQFENTKAVWTYAHETLATTSLDPTEIMQTHAQLLDTFRATRIDSAQFFNLCKQAYEMVCIKNGSKIGERNNIVEMLTPLAWLWPEAQQGKKGFSQLPKYILAYQLQKLRTDKMIQSNGIRIDLGAATGGSTRNKNNVIYIPNGATEGQYYLSVCFRQV